MARPHRIWVVDDDPELRQLLAHYLGEQGYQVRCLENGAQLAARLSGQLGGERPDLLVLDLMLPDEDGLSLLRRLRDSDDSLPVLMLTARADGVDRIIGLEQGADDYLAKPFLPRELSARIAAVLRRHQSSGTPGSASTTAQETVRFGRCVFDPRGRTLERDGEAVPITSGECDLLSVLVQHPQRPLSRERLIALARGPASETDSRSMDVQISRLRKLIESDPRRPRHLQTVWGYGYVFVPDGIPHGR